jgi:hypothetical protein
MMMAAMLPGELCWVDYGEAPVCVHARLLLDHVQGNDWVIATPDHDVYVEEMAQGNPDFNSFFLVEQLVPFRLERQWRCFTTLLRSRLLVCKLCS